MVDLICSDFSDSNVTARIFAIADNILARGDQVEIGGTAEYELASRLAESRRKVLTINVPLKIGISFAMWREVPRLLPRSASNPSGENCLQVKIEALEWLFAGTPVEWRLFAVDDGCPDDSYATALGQASSSKVTVLRLADLLPAKQAPLSRLNSAHDSVKGGAIMAGTLRALEDGCTHIGYTDCDNSVHLGQLGLLLHPLLTEGKLAALGDRNASDSFVIRHQKRGQFKILRHMMLMLGAGKVPFADVPSPFKLFEARFFASILPKLQIFDFSFEYDVVPEHVSNWRSPCHSRLRIPGLL